MKNKHQKLITLATIFLILSGGIDYIFYQNYDKYIATYLQKTDILNKGMKYHCINYDEFNEISFKEGGLNGDCGFIGDNSSKNQLAICPSQANDTCGVISVNYNANNKCYEFYTFGENISGYTIASSTIELIKNSPKDYVDFKIIKVKFSLLKIIRWVLFFLSLFFIISALIYGFKWEEFNKK